MTTNDGHETSLGAPEGVSLSDLEPRLRVLLVDDDPDFLLQEQLILEGAGFEVITADSVDSARARLDEGPPDVAVFDMMMEVMDAGLVLAATVKRRYPELPVLLVTAVTQETGLCFDAAEGAERAWVKADRVLAKPVRPEQLLGEIRELLVTKAGHEASVAP
jgi:two-component system, OmpR family, response regulator